MQQIRNPQLKHRSKFSQLVLLDTQTQVISSCDSIFQASNFASQPLQQQFPFLESIYPSILALPPYTDVNFSKIETPLAELPGTYDFSFVKILVDQQEQILWCIYDYTDLYQDYKQFQQRKNELEIHREMLEQRYRKLQHKDDLQMQQNIILEHLDHLQRTYFNKVKTALLAPVNPLDGISFMLIQTQANDTFDYIGQLRVTLENLQLILQEFDLISDAKSANTSTFSVAQTCQAIQTLFQEEKAITVDLDIEQLPTKSQQLRGNNRQLQQILLGLLINATQLHPQASFKLRVIALSHSDISKISLRFMIIEYMNSTSTFLTIPDYTTLIYRLSVVRQLIEAQGGQIEVSQNPKNLSIIIGFDLSFELAT